MTITHPSTIALVADMERRERLAKIAAERLADQLPATPRARFAPVATTRHLVGSLLVAVGTWLQGRPAAIPPLVAPPVGHLDAAGWSGRIGR